MTIFAFSRAWKIFDFSCFWYSSQPTLFAARNSTGCVPPATVVFGDKASRLLLLIRRRGRRLPGFPALESHAIAVLLQTLVARLLIIVEVRALG